MFVNRELKTIFLAHAGTATRSTTDALGLGFQMTGGYHSPIPDDYPWDPDTWEVVTTVRHHADWLVSRWARLFRNDPWDPVRMDDHLRRMGHRIYFQHTQGILFPFVRGATHVMRYETLKEHLAAIMNVRLARHIGATSKGQSGLSYDQALQYARSRYAGEMEVLGYE